MNYIMFNCKAACEIGMAGAVLLENILFWVNKNAANKVNLHAGHYWTYNSYDAFEKLFPFMTARKIKYELHKLESAGYIETGEFNSNKFDRTKWYTVTEKGRQLLGSVEETKLSDVEETKSSGREKKMNVSFHLTDKNNTDINTDKNTEPAGSVSSAKKEVPVPFPECDEFQEAFQGFLEMRKAKKAKMTERAKKMLFKRLQKLAPHDPYEQAAILDQSTRNSWTDVYPLKPAENNQRRARASNGRKSMNEMYAETEALLEQMDKEQQTGGTTNEFSGT